MRGRPILTVYGEIDLAVVRLQDAFDKAGVESFIARTPADAMKLLQRFEFDAVVINHVYGLDDGLDDLLKELVDTPTLALCYAMTPATLARVPCLAKPVRADAVIGVLERLIGGSRGKG